MHTCTLLIVVANYLPLLKVEDRLAMLKQQFEEKTKEKETLEIKVDQCAKKLGRAEKLIGGLGGERQR